MDGQSSRIGVDGGLNPVPEGRKRRMRGGSRRMSLRKRGIEWRRTTENQD